MTPDASRSADPELVETLQRIFHHENIMKITVKEVAQKMNLNVCTVMQYISGERKMPFMRYKEMSIILIKNYKDSRLAGLCIPASHTIVTIEKAEKLI